MDLTIFQAFSSMRAAEASAEMTREMVSLQTFQTLHNMVRDGVFSNMDQAVTSWNEYRSGKK